MRRPAPNAEGRVQNKVKKNKVLFLKTIYNFIVGKLWEVKKKPFSCEEKGPKRVYYLHSFK